MKEENIYTDAVTKICYYKRGTDKIYAYFSHNGKRYRFSTRTSDFQQAVHFANQKHQEAKEGRSIKVKTLSQVYSEFIEHKRMEGRKSSTIDDYEITVKFVFEYFGKDRDISTITKKDINDFRLWRRNYYVDNNQRQPNYKRSGKLIRGKEFKQEHAANRTINKTVGLLISILRFACFEREYISSDKIPKFTRLHENVRKVFINSKELGILFTYFFDRNMLYHANVMIFCFYSGCRYPSELNKLRWKDIDFKEKIILFMDRKSKGKVSVNTRFPMLPILEEILTDLKSWYPESMEDDYVFRNRNGKQVKDIRKAFQSAITACNLGEKIKSMYGLRHSFATYWIHTKMPLNNIAHLMGHADTVMLERRYAHLVDDKINEHFQDAYAELLGSTGTSIVEKSKTRTVFENDSLEEYRKLKRGESVHPDVEKTL